jgi:hypothetical protein
MNATLQKDSFFFAFSPSKANPIWQMKIVNYSMVG